jgi:hypothetical protein
MALRKSSSSSSSSSKCRHLHQQLPLLRPIGLPVFLVAVAGLVGSSRAAQVLQDSRRLTWLLQSTQSVLALAVAATAATNRLPVFHHSTAPSTALLVLQVTWQSFNSSSRLVILQYLAPAQPMQCLQLQQRVV